MNENDLKAPGAFPDNEDINTKSVFEVNKRIEDPARFSDYSARFDGKALLCDLCLFRLQCARKTAGED